MEEKDALGMPVTHQNLFPDQGLMADELGSSTNMCKDKQGARNYYVGSDVRAFVPSTNDDVHITVLGFTSFSGKAVIAVVIIKKKSEWTHAATFGLDAGKKWYGKPHDVHLNTGKGPRYPGGPYC